MSGVCVLLWVEMFMVYGSCFMIYVLIYLWMDDDSDLQDLECFFFVIFVLFNLFTPFLPTVKLRCSYRCIDIDR